MTTTELWFKQSRHFLLLAAMQTAVILLLIFVVVPVGDRALSAWRDTLNPELMPTNAEMQQQIAFWEHANDRLAAHLDSASALSQKVDSRDAQLQAIQSSVAVHRVSLITCELRTLENREGTSATAFDLQLRGPFVGVGQMITELESSAMAFIVDHVSLEGTESGSSTINASLTLVSRRGQ